MPFTQDNSDDSWKLGNETFHSRLLVGTGKYSNPTIQKAAIEASGAEIITVSIRRMGLDAKEKSTAIEELFDDKHYTYLPNSAGCYTAEEALRTLRLARELGGWILVKLEVIGDKNTLMPDAKETIRAAGILKKEGFEVMAYTNDDLDVAKALEQAGCVAIMPLGSPIGTGLGIEYPEKIADIVAAVSVPVLVDAGIGTASDAALAMELGCAGVLLNTAIAEAKNPVAMAEAMKLGVQAGRKAFLAGRMPKRAYASPSSPIQGKVAS